MQLGDIVDIVRSKVDVSQLDRERYVSTENLLPELGGLVCADRLPPASKVTAFVQGDVLFSNIRTYFRKVWFADRDGGASADVIVFRPKNGVQLENRYLYYLLANQSFIDHTSAAAKGAKMPRGDKDAMLHYQVDLPDLPTQRRIAGILSAYDELIANNQRRIAILEEMARALYREWFVRYKAPGVVLGEDGVPEGWEVKPLQALMSNQIGGGWGKDVEDEEHSEAAYVIRGADIPEMRMSDNAEVPFRYHTPSNLRSRRLIPGDIIFEVSGGTKDRPVGRTLLMTEEMLSAFDSDVICASFCKRITPDEDAFGAELLYLSLREGYDSGEIEQYQVQSTGLSNFKWTEYIEQTTRLVPPPELRDRFKALVKPMFSQMTILGLQAMNLRRTRDLLLPRLMSGRVEVEAP